MQGISLARANKITYTLVNWRRFIGPFRENSITDLFAGIAKLKEARTKDGTLYKQNTVHDYIVFLKRFYLWLLENGYVDLPEKKLLKIRPPPVNTMIKVASDLLTPAEVMSIVEACVSTRDRALIMMLYEGGFRVGELGTLRWGDIKFDKFGAVVNVNYKTGLARYIRLVMSVEHLAKWRNAYPFAPEGDALVFSPSGRRRSPMRASTSS